MTAIVPSLDGYFAPFCLIATEDLLVTFRDYLGLHRGTDLLSSSVRTGLVSDERDRDPGKFVPWPSLLPGAADLQVARLFGKTVWVYRETQPSPIWRGSPSCIVGEAAPLWRYEVVGEMKGSALDENIAKAWVERCAFERSGAIAEPAGALSRTAAVRLEFRYSVSTEQEKLHDVALRDANQRIMMEFPFAMEPVRVARLAASHAARRASAANRDMEEEVYPRLGISDEAHVTRWTSVATASERETCAIETGEMQASETMEPGL